MASCCLGVAVADTVHHYCLLPPHQKALLCLTWYKGEQREVMSVLEIKFI